MYLNHYNLTLKPFEISPDPKFLWLGEKHNEALTAMRYGILDNKGFICLTGDVGTGKTTLVNGLINSSKDNVVFAKLSDPPLDKLDFFNLAADAFGMNKKFSTKGDFISHLRHFLNNAYDHNQEVVLVIEEAQRFDQEQLEEVRLISNIERPEKKLINIIFVGQNEFDDILNKNKPLRQRVSIIHKLEPLQETETKQYVIHRLKIAGSESEIFSPGAFRELYSFSEGNPRLINIICDLALLTGYAENKKIIEPETIRECAVNRLLPTQQREAAIEYVKASSMPTMKTKRGLQPDTLVDSHQKFAKKVPLKPTRFKLAYVSSIFMVFLLSIFGYLYFFGDNHAPYRDFKTFLGQTLDRYTGSKLETPSQKPDEIATQQSNIAGTEIQALDFTAQKASFENQIDELKSRNNALAADLAELNVAKERIAELEGVAASREQALSEAEQKVTELTNALDQEKKGQDLLRAELSTNADQVTEVQHKLESSQSNAIKFQEEIERYKKDIAALQGQLSDLQTQKTSSDTQLDQLKSRNEALIADLAELKETKERVAELEQKRSSYEDLITDIQELRGVEERVAALQAELATKDQALSQAAQEITDLTSAIDQEKTSRETLISEGSIKADLVPVLQEKLDAALAGRAEIESDVEKSRKEIVALQEQLEDVSAQKDGYESQLEQQRSSYEELTANIQELRGVKERVAALEGDLARKDQALSQAEQTVAELTNALDQEKTSKETLISESSIKAELVAELQGKLEAARSSRAVLENDVKKSQKEIAALQEQILDVNAQKDAYESQLEQQRSSYEELSADIQGLRGVEERVAALEGELAKKDQALSQSEQKVAELTSALDQEKTSRETLDSERLTKADLVAELQGKLEVALSSRAELENDVEKSRKEIVALQSQLKEREAQQAPTKPSPAIADVKIESPSKSEAIAEQGESLSPIDIMDWLFKQKAK